MSTEHIEVALISARERLALAERRKAPTVSGPASSPERLAARVERARAAVARLESLLEPTEGGTA